MLQLLVELLNQIKHTIKKDYIFQNHNAGLAIDSNYAESLQPQ
jgi:hypothetical protein